MSNVSFQIANLLEKMCSNDKDFRFMATNDLMSELQKDSIKLDDDSERKVVRMLLKLLEDKNGEVQNLAVKCLGPLVSKVKDSQVEVIVETLCSNMASSTEELRDISSIGLKTVIAELPLSASTLAATVCKNITGRLSETVAKKEDIPVQLEAIEIMSDLLARFGTLLVPYHASVLDSLLPQLASARMAAIKRTITAIGYLVLSCNGQLYNKLIEHLLDGLSKYTDLSKTKSYILCLGAICRQSGHRFGEHVEKVMPSIINNIRKNDDDLTEFCLQALEAFVYRCPKEITPHIPQILSTCLEYIAYDPNYNYDGDEDDGMDDDMDMDQEAQESDDEYSDDDDVSWKVRRAATKCIEALISSRHDLLQELYRTVAPALISRFKEREESVKSDVFHAFVVLLRQARPAIMMSSESDSMDHENVIMSMLQQQVPAVVRILHRQLKEKSVKTRHGAFSLLSELVQVLPGVLAPHMNLIIPGILYSLTEKTAASQMKCDTLIFIQTVLKNHSPDVIQPHVEQLTPPVIQAVNENFYKVISEALLVLQLIAKSIRPLDVPSNFNFQPYVKPLYETTLARLRTADIDQEVKERAISCMGQILATFGDVLKPELDVCLAILLDRLKNEITRITAVRALSKVASSPLRVNIESLLPEGMPLLATFLRKNQRNLKLATLSLLDSIVQNYSGSLRPAMLEQVLQEIPALLVESDLTIAQHALVLLTSVTRNHRTVIQHVSPMLLNETLNLAKSPLLQGGALKALLSFLQALAESGISGLSQIEIINRLGGIVSKGTSQKDAYHSLAQAVGALAVSRGAETIKIVERFLNEASKKQSTDSQQVFSLLSTGAIGKHVDLSGVPALRPVLLESFNSPSEDVRSAASYALGSVAVGNLNAFLPFVLQEIETQPKRQYILLHSLKEVISSHAASPNGAAALAPYIPQIWRQLFLHCESPVEGTRKVVAECLGKLTMMDPAGLLSQLKAARHHESPQMRQTVITAVKFTISDQPQPIDGLLRQCIGEFLSTLEDSDLNVRMVALVLFLSAAHHKPALIRDLLDTLLPHVYRETNVRKELIREVEMGPFKHTVDDGLDMRKCAFECMYTMLDSCLDKIDVYEFLNHVESGLKDHYDIKMLTYLMLSRLTTLAPNTVLQRLEQLVEPLRTTLNQKVKANAVKQEYEKQDDLKRSAMRAVAALQSVPDADKNAQLNDLMAMIRGTPELLALYESMKKDSSPNADQAMMDLS